MGNVQKTTPELVRQACLEDGMNEAGAQAIIDNAPEDVWDDPWDRDRARVATRRMLARFPEYRADPAYDPQVEEIVDFSRAQSPNAPLMSEELVRQTAIDVGLNAQQVDEVVEQARPLFGRAPFCEQEIRGAHRMYYFADSRVPRTVYPATPGQYTELEWRAACAEDGLSDDAINLTTEGRKFPTAFETRALLREVNVLFLQVMPEYVRDTLPPTPRS